MIDDPVILILIGAFFGIIAFITIAHLIAFFVYSDRSYLFYVLHCACIIMYFAMTNLLPGVRDMEIWRQVVEKLRVLSVPLLVLSSAAFIREFLQTRRHNPRIDRILKIYMVLALPFIVIVPIFRYEDLDSLSRIFGLFAPLVIIPAGIAALRRGFQPARLFLIAWGIFSLGAFGSIFQGTYGEWELTAFQVSAVIETSLLAVALASRMQTTRREKEKLRRAKARDDARYHSIFDATGAATALINSAGQIILTNTELDQLTGVESGNPLPDADHISITSLSHPSSEVAIREAISHTLETGASGQFEASIVDIHGRKIDTLAAIRRISGTEEMVISLMDITERNKAEEQLIRAEKMAALGTVMAGVAHEINNPNNFIAFNLPTIREFLQEIQPHLEKTAEEHDGLTILKLPHHQWFDRLSKLLDTMEHGSERIQNIVGELKDYVREEKTDTRHPEFLSTVVDRALSLVGKQLTKDVERVEVHHEPDMPQIIMNAGRIEQVVVNMFVNAAQASKGPGASIEILTGQSKKSGWAQIVIKDNGHGMSPDVVSHIFEPFFTTKGPTTGTGLGLAISQRVIDDHGGSIEVETAPEQGARFTILLPIEEPS